MALESLLIAPLYRIRGISSSENSTTTIDPRVFSIYAYKWHLTETNPTPANFNEDLNSITQNYRIGQLFRSANGVIIMNPEAQGVATINEYTFEIDFTSPSQNATGAVNIGSNIVTNGNDFIYRVDDIISGINFDTISGEITTTVAQDVDLNHEGAYIAYFWEPQYNYKVTSSFDLTTPEGYKEQYVVNDIIPDTTGWGIDSSPVIQGAALCPYSGVKYRVLNLKLFLESETDYYSLVHLSRNFYSVPMYIHFGPNKTNLNVIEQEFSGLVGFLEVKGYKEKLGGYEVSIKFTEARTPSDWVTLNDAGT